MSELEAEKVEQSSKGKVSLPAAVSVGMALLGSVGGPFTAVGCAMVGAFVGRKLEERISGTSIKDAELDVEEDEDDQEP